MQTMHKSKTAFKIISLQLVCILSIFFAISCSGKTEEGPLLDGRVFTVITMPEGNAAEAALERISFTNGRFDNDNCHIWGFGDGAYAAKSQGDSIVFTATTSSTKEGSMFWKGTIKDTTLSGTMVWSKPGQADMQYVFSAQNIALTNLDGQRYDIVIMDGDVGTIETVTFADGKFESPGCYAWGFSASEYQAYILEGKTHFQSLYKSDKEGEMLFYGIIDGNVLRGTQYWIKEGQEGVYYSLSGEKSH